MQIGKTLSTSFLNNEENVLKYLNEVYDKFKILKNDILKFKNEHNITKMEQGNPLSNLCRLRNLTGVKLRNEINFIMDYDIGGNINKSNVGNLLKMGEILLNTCAK